MSFGCMIQAFVRIVHFEHARSSLVCTPAMQEAPSSQRSLTMPIGVPATINGGIKGAHRPPLEHLSAEGRRRPCVSVVAGCGE